MNRVVIHKVQSLQRCVARAREEYAAATEDFAGDYTRQDAAVLNSDIGLGHRRRSDSEQT